MVHGLLGYMAFVHDHAVHDHAVMHPELVALLCCHVRALQLGQCRGAERRCCPQEGGCAG